MRDKCRFWHAQALGRGCSSIRGGRSGPRRRRQPQRSGADLRPKPLRLPLHWQVTSRLSGSREKSLQTESRRWADSAQSSGAQGVGALAVAGFEGYSSKNLARDMQKLMGESQEERELLYWAEVGDAWWPMVLPHEGLAWLLRTHWTEEQTARPPANGSKTHEGQCSELGLQLAEVTPILLWGDSMPYTKKKSIFVLLMGLAHEPLELRLPLLVVPGKDRNTIEALEKIILWSLRVGAIGLWPSCRPLDTPGLGIEITNPGDKQR